MVSEVRSIYSRGVMDDRSHSRNVPESEVIYVQRDKRAVKYPATEVYSLSDARDKLLSDLSGLTGHQRGLLCCARTGSMTS